MFLKRKIFLLFKLFLIILSLSLFNFTKAEKDNFNFNFLSQNIPKEEKIILLKSAIKEIKEKIKIIISEREKKQNNKIKNEKLIAEEKREKERVEVDKILAEQERLRIEEEQKKKEIEDFNNNILKKINNDLQDSLKAKSFDVHIFNPNKEYIVSSKKIFHKDEYSAFPAASVVKLLTAITAWENFDHNKRVKITQKSLNQYGDYGLVINEKFTLYDSMVAMLTISSNDIAYAIATSGYSGLEKKFIVLMKEKASKIGMENSYFRSSNGLDDIYGNSTADSSAADIVVLLKYFYKNYPYLSKRTVGKVNYVDSNIKKHTFYNTNILLKEYKNFKLSKTGYESSAGGNLATIYMIDEDNYLAIAVLGSTKKERFYDTEKIIRAARKYLKNKK